MSRRTVLRALGAAAIAAVLLVGVVQALSKSHKPKDSHLSLAEQQQRLAGAPEPFAALHRQASQLLDGGPSAVNERLASLRGHPVVINKWASWCGPCRLEFPVFQRVATKLGKRVAFLGLDGRDATGDARRFLSSNPVSYPSYKDPNERAAHHLKAGTYYPTTVFIDARGRRTVHQGPYDDDATLERDIRRYALDA
jgi:thiol-disulfide isomerase/thioredoxin